LPRGPAGNGPNPAVPSIQRTSGNTAAGGRLERVTVGRSRRPALVDDEARQPRAPSRDVLDETLLLSDQAFVFLNALPAFAVT
jgi:hypothetical protein